VAVVESSMLQLLLLILDWWIIHAADFFRDVGGTLLEYSTYRWCNIWSPFETLQLFGAREIIFESFQKMDCSRKLKNILKNRKFPKHFNRCLNTFLMLAAFMTVVTGVFIGKFQNVLICQIKWFINFLSFSKYFS
jgi:hypothetical protein